MSKLTETDISCLTQWDTPTICNALEIVAPHRRGFGFTVHPFSCLDASLAPIAGYARTAKIRAASPDLAEASDQVNRMSYYEYIAEGLQPSIVVIEDLDPSPGQGAFWGEVHTAVHKGLGALGVITNGSYRDVTDSAKGFQVLGGLVGPSHAFVHLIEFGSPVNVHGMAVNDRDVIHADQHGAVVIPANVVKEIPAAVELMNQREAPILKAARSSDFNIEKLRQAISDSKEIH